LKGPEPIVSVMFLNGSVSASFSRRMTGAVPALIASAVSTKPKGSFRRSTNVLSSLALNSSTNGLIAWPSTSRTIQRFSEAMTSRVVTGCPSRNLRPGRSVKV